MRNKFFLKLAMILLISAFVLSGCDQQKDQAKAKAGKTKIITVTLKVPIKRYYFTGTLNPITVVPVIAPVQGAISQMHFVYGGKVEKGTVVVTLRSHTLGENFRKAINTYLKAKQAYLTAKESFVGDTALHNAGVSSDQKFAGQKIDFENKFLSYLQSVFQLKKVLKLAKVPFKEIQSLSIDKPKVINKVLERHFHNVEILANSSGIALFPSSDSNNNSNKKITVGLSVKQDQLLVNIGDLSGFQSQVNVNEVMVNHIHANMPVKVTGTAFPGITLKGIVSSVSSQAHNSSNSGMSLFGVTIKIPAVAKAAKKLIRVGMSATFEMDIPKSPQIIIPISAVKQLNDKAVVTVVDKTGKKKTVPVVTGSTTPKTVIILSGLKVGDRVVVPSD